MTDNRPLAGVKVVDFGWAIVGNVASKILGDFGAEVWKIESSVRLSGERIRRLLKREGESPDDRAWFGHLSTSKRSLTVNLRDERGKDMVRKLVAEADILFENFSPGTIDRMGFGYDALRAIKPDIIMASGSIFGQSGPMSRLSGTDATGAARSGRMGASGYPDGPPILPWVTYGDSVLPYFIVAAIGAALKYRNDTGKGCRIDGAMVDMIAQQMAPSIVAPEEFPARMGNRYPHAAPHGVYPVAGEDRWIAIEAWSDDEWKRLCAVLNLGGLAADSRFATLAGRKQNEDALDEALAAATATREGFALMKELQEQGLSAGMAQTAGEIADDDPQLAYRAFQQPVEHATMGVFPHQRSPITLSRTPPVMAPAPRLGGNTQEVLERIVGLAPDEFARLAAERVFS